MAIDEREFRNTLGCFATGVAVVTAAAEGIAPFGVTVNSFSAVSLDPPLVSWCLGKDSSSFDLFSELEHYTVNVLSESQQGLANYFAQKNDHGFADIAYQSGVNGCPLMEGVVASFECKVVNRVDAGDHVLLLGEVMQFSRHDGRRPLLFAMGQYANLGRSE